MMGSCQHPSWAIRMDDAGACCGCGYRLPTIDELPAATAREVEQARAVERYFVAVRRRLAPDED